MLQCRLCTVCNQHKPLEDFRSASGKPNEYCKVCMHYVNQLSYKSSASKSKYKIDDIREAYKARFLICILQTLLLEAS